MTDDMPRSRHRFLRHEKNRHGTWCWYFRKDNGPRIRMPEPYGSDAFEEAYQAALAGRKPEARTPPSGTISWLVRRYKESAQYSSLAPSSRRIRDQFLAQIVRSAGDKSFRKVSKRHIQNAIDDRRAKPHAANSFLTAMNRFFEWAVTNDHIPVNPCDGIKPIRAKIKGHHVWSLDEVEAFKKRHPLGTRARLALDILLYTGLRRSDAVVAGKQHIREGVLSLRTQKTGAWVHIPVAGALRQSVDAAPTGDLTILTGEDGSPFVSPDAFGKWFHRRCAEAGLKECSAHGLRKAGATIAANNGATAHELMAMYGWSRISMAEVYTKEANRRQLAHAAAERIANGLSPHRKKGAARKRKL